MISIDSNHSKRTKRCSVIVSMLKNYFAHEWSCSVNKNCLNEFKTRSYSALAGMILTKKWTPQLLIKVNTKKDIHQSWQCWKIISCMNNHALQLKNFLIKFKIRSCNGFEGMVWLKKWSLQHLIVASTEKDVQQL